MKVQQQSIVKWVAVIGLVFTGYIFMHQSGQKSDLQDLLRNLENWSSSDLHQLAKAMESHGFKGDMGAETSKNGDGNDEINDDTTKGDIISEDSRDSKDSTSKDTREDSREKRSIHKRSKKSDKGNNNNSQNNPLNVVGVRVAIAFVGIIFINLIVITVHHIYLKLSRSEKLYRTVEHTLSPY